MPQGVGLKGPAPFPHGFFMLKKHGYDDTMKRPAMKEGYNSYVGYGKDYTCHQ